MRLKRIDRLIHKSSVGIALCLLFTSLEAQTRGPANSSGPLPQVASAPDPIYPKIALAAHISGTVQLHVSTDGKRVVSIESEDGPMMLRQSAEENVRA